MVNTAYTVTKLDRPEHAGDWHDKPLRYRVDGLPEIQKFSTKKRAHAWARIRRKCATFNEACAISIARSN
jgi:hypothetical protein